MSYRRLTSFSATALVLLAACGDAMELEPGTELVVYGGQVWDGTGSAMTGPSLVAVL